MDDSSHSWSAGLRRPRAGRSVQTREPTDFWWAVSGTRDSAAALPGPGVAGAAASGGRQCCLRPSNEATHPLIGIGSPLAFLRLSRAPCPFPARLCRRAGAAGPSILLPPPIPSFLPSFLVRPVTILLTMCVFDRSMMKIRQHNICAYSMHTSPFSVSLSLPITDLVDRWKWSHPLRHFNCCSICTHTCAVSLSPTN